MVTTILRIVSGGQTGADRAALDFAIEQGILHGGWCPKWRKAEDGAIPERYALVETPSANYLQRTEWNVRDADATIVFSIASDLSGGSRRTEEFAAKHQKPFLHVHAGTGIDEAAERLRTFLHVNMVRVLNIAGPRVSKEPEVEEFVHAVLRKALEGQ